MNPVIVNAQMCRVTPMHVRVLLSQLRQKGLKADEVELADAQAAAWEEIGLVCVSVFVARLTIRTGDPLPTKPTARTMAGIPLNIVNFFSNSEIHFIDKDRCVIGKIINLAIPVGF